MNKHLILMIEDDRRFASIHMDVLREHGFTVVHAVNGDEGLKRASVDNPAVILLDIGLPKKDGFQVLRELRANEATAKIPVIMLSRLSTRDDIDLAFSLGADEYMIKSQHTPEDVVAHIIQRVGAKPGFTVPELILVLCAIASLGVLAWMQINTLEMRARDAETLALVTQFQAGLKSAEENGLNLCYSVGVSECKLCKTTACAPGQDVTTDYLPSADAWKTLPVCDTGGGRCQPRVQGEGRDWDIFFYLEKGTGGLRKGGHNLRANGAMD